MGSARNDENTLPFKGRDWVGMGFSSKRSSCPAYAIFESRIRDNIVAASKFFLDTIKRKDILPDILYLSLSPSFCSAVVLQAYIMVTQGCPFHAVSFKITQTVSRDLIININAAHYPEGEGP